jgi:putative radical SAM enzyme (TIGR03279 family)
MIKFGCENMNNEITVVKKGSIAEELGIETGDVLISINDVDVEDIIDYKFLITEEFLTLEILKKSDNEIWSFEIEKEYDEDLGLEFSNSIMDNARSCCNNCLFCFVDQLPEGMRKTLYFKDDDSRLSFLQGNFVTMTNMKDDDIDRIIKYRISPINISVHTTNPELRVKMLNNRFAGDILQKLKKLAKAGISMNCQVVACPGVNNGEELLKTIKDLYDLYPAVKNTAVVPVGLTKYRKGLKELKMYDKETAASEINAVLKLQKKFIEETGEPFVRLSDEFYVLAGIDVPESDFYGDFDQLEDGVGMIRYFRDAVNNTISGLKKDIKGSFTLICGVSAYDEIKMAAEKINNINKNLKINVAKIINDFFGDTITVSGLITGRDIVKQLKNAETGEFIVIPDNMLKKGEKIFLDDVKIEEIEKDLNKKIVVCSYDGDNLIYLINNNSTEV